MNERKRGQYKIGNKVKEGEKLKEMKEKQKQGHSRIENKGN